jgi:hypothetical protein
LKEKQSIAPWFVLHLMRILMGIKWQFLPLGPEAILEHNY